MNAVSGSGTQKPIDRRARRTRRLLKEALFALILEKGYDTVTIEDITDRADLGRTTFYLHYRDKEELLIESIDSMAEELLARLPTPAWYKENAEPGSSGLVREAILISFQHAAENAQLYRIIQRGAGASKASSRLHGIIRQKAAELVQGMVLAGLAQPRVPMDVFSNYFAGSLLATITWWLEADMPYPPEQMVEMFRQMFFQGGRYALGVNGSGLAAGA